MQQTFLLEEEMGEELGYHHLLQRTMPTKQKTLRLILGDQLNSKHSWYKSREDHITYVLMEVRSETDQTVHHIQKLIAFFAAMRKFAIALEKANHKVQYLKINDPCNKQSFAGNIAELIREQNFQRLEYQRPDEYFLDLELEALSKKEGIDCQVYDTEHFLCSVSEFCTMYRGKKSVLMENFYRYMRKKHQILMVQDEPLFGQWNFDAENRKKIPENLPVPPPFLFDENVEAVEQDIRACGIKTMGQVDSRKFIWPTDRRSALLLLDYFVQHGLPYFGTYQDTMLPKAWSLFHSRISFALNAKMISPLEVVTKVIEHWNANRNDIAYHQVEGFVRQIIGWREYMHGMYWLKMPDFAKSNFFSHSKNLPSWYWTGNTKMNCLKNAIGQSLEYAYAHHIQRLMVTGNFALLAGVDPDEVDQWYLGIYIDALSWVEITNTRGMSQYADGGNIATKPYISSASYMHKMGHYCSTCVYQHDKKIGEKSCPFNSLYWHFLVRHEAALKKNPRMGMMYATWYKMNGTIRGAILDQAEKYLGNLEQL